MKRKLMGCLLGGLLALSSYIGTANAAIYDFSGNLTSHNQVISIDFNLATDATNVRVWTDSFLNGLNFDPITAVWRQSGSDYVLVGENDDNSSIAPGQTYWDSGLFFDTLSAGDYLFTIARFANFANGMLLSQGFRYDNETPSPLYGGTFYDVHLDGVDGARDHGELPEPSTFILLGAGLAGLGFVRRRAKQ